MKRKPSAKHAKQALDRSIDSAIKASREFDAAIGPTWEAAKKLAARAVITADIIESVIAGLTRRAIPDIDDQIGDLRRAAESLRAQVKTSRAALG